MCLAIAGQIIAIHSPEPPFVCSDSQLWRTATIDYGGVQQQVSLACLPEARLGDRVLVHVGVAISLVEG
jgi:hydrogenase expression/formation protein HypC